MTHDNDSALINMTDLSFSQTQLYDMRDTVKKMGKTK